MKIALDHDSTLAATGVVAFELIGDDAAGRTYADVESWEWGLETFGAARYLSGMWHAWTLRPLEVPLMDETVVATVKKLAEDHEIHVVTSQPDHMGVAEGKEEWLQHHGIPYEKLVVVGPDTTKAFLDYDVYVDDKPYLPARVNRWTPGARVFVRDHRYNRDAPGEYVRIHKLADVLPYLVDDEAELTTQEWIDRDIRENAELHEAFADNGNGEI
jgi:5'(3')-deoxyribonucleotidase